MSGLATYRRGPTLNVAVASGRSTADLAAPFDLLPCRSEGSGRLGGSLLAGSRELVERAVRHRRMLGGAMRQIGIYAAAGCTRSITTSSGWRRTTGMP
jgi:threonine aldolase